MRWTIILAGLVCLATAPGAVAEEAGQLEKGAHAYRTCAHCHSLEPGVNLSGPSLAGAWGRVAAADANFSRYTAALKSAALVWDAKTLDAWLEAPEALVPDTTMTIPGIADAETRAALIAFLEIAMGPDGAAEVIARGLLPERVVRGPVPADLSRLGPAQRIKTIRHCDDAFVIATEEGLEFPVWETNVRLKVDAGPRGPGDGQPVYFRSGTVGDRVSVVFASVAQMHRMLSEAC